ncbi:MerR family DNA-binding protein [Rhodoferax sp. BAB1]|uniref:MerR family transcriptional regulator n=1 Tax=Rhodoferax sp. BAB1 TaxID=2741720 RepID=UPI00157511E9|nr:MerR family DNA-binding protein [Rhodoferax sp. BAB1]QKO23386.1 MerR family DNA-binding protein [Rhodoferax sp. BAB1]
MSNTPSHSLNDPGMTIGDLAKVAGVNVETIRFYQRKGLMPEPDRPVGSIRRYGPTNQSRLNFIKAAKRLGFSLDETAQLLQLEDGASCAQARVKAEVKLAEVRLKLADLQRMEAALSGLILLCGAGKRNVRCPLIAAMERHQVPLPT